MKCRFLAVAILAFTTAGCSANQAAIEEAKAEAAAARAAQAKAEAELARLKAGAAPDRALLETRRAAMAQAFNRNDPDAWAAVYAPDAEFVEDTGEVLQGPAAIQKSLAKLFADNKGIRVDVLRTNERFITPEVVLEDGAFRVSGLKGGGHADGRYVTVWAHRDGQWVLVSHRNWVPTKQPGS